MRQRSGSERGQAFALMVISLIALLGTAAIVMDVGFAWYAKRQVQAQADAAALAGAQELPNKTLALATAIDYANKNLPANLTSEAAPVVKMGCAANTDTWCKPDDATAAFQANTIQVKLAAKTPTWFAKLLGLTNFDVSGTATACQPCSSQPVDVVLVVDRTGSMCDSQTSGMCNDLNNAKDGVRTLLGILDPDIDQVGLVAFPPYNTSGGVCGSTSATTSLSINGTGVPLAQARSIDPNNYDSSSLVYLNDRLLSDFQDSKGALNEGSTLLQHVKLDTTSGKSCIRSFGSTSYDDALRAGKAELDLHGRVGVPHIMVFMTDGEANMGSYFGPALTNPNHGLEPELADPATGFNMSPWNSSSTVNPGDAQPCQSAINAAKAIKDSGVTIYTIGYALGTAQCVHGVWGQVDGSYASSQYDWQDFKCVAIGTAPAGPYKLSSWAIDPHGLEPGHYQGIYAAPPHAYPAATPPTSDKQITQNNVSGDGTNLNPCTNKKILDPGGSGLMVNAHDEQPRITSFATVKAIASDPTVTTPTFFYNKVNTGDLTQIFAAIGADISKGTSRLVSDSYLTS
jgi:Flp pilus assembly protein TadG